MTDNFEHLILDHLRGMRTDLAGIKEDVREIKSRVSFVEHNLSALRLDATHMVAEDAAQHLRYDRMIKRIERVEQRLDLNDES